MPYIIYSKGDAFAATAAKALREAAGFSDANDIKGMKHYVSGKIGMLELDEGLVYSDWLDDLGTDYIVFISRHSSAKGVISFTAHAEGNWNDKSDLGGRPHALGMASPGLMLSFLRPMKKFSGNIGVVYEATHHGPLLNTPSCFVELGPDAKINVNDRKELLNRLSRGIYAMLYDSGAEYGKVAIGIGGMHYASKFTKYALEGTYAFSHIMPKYYVGQIGMLRQAVERSDVKPEIAVIEWKSINSASRNKILAKLEELGMDYEKV